MSKKGIIVIGFLAIGFVALAQMVFDWTGIGSDSLRLVNTNVAVSYGFDAHPSFYSNNSRFFYFVTRTGLRYETSGGENRWNQQFSLTRPHMITNGEMVAVGETNGGRIIFVFDSSGPIFTANLNNPVLGFSLNQAGYLSVITQHENGYGIYVYNRHRNVEPLYSKRITQEANPMVVPLAAEVSEDGRYIVIAYWDLNQDVTMVVDFRFINQEDAPFGTYGLFTQKTFAGETPLAMRFMANNTLLLITDRQIKLYSITGDEVQIEWSRELQNYLDQIAFNGNNRFAYVAGPPAGADTNYADPIGTVNIFDLNGLTGSFNIGRRGTHLSMGHNAVIVGADRYFHAVNIRGESLWHHNALHDVRDMLFLENTDTVLIAGPNRAYVWRRLRERDDVYVGVE